MENEGWFKYYRQDTMGSPVFESEGLLKVWVWCRAKANYEDKWVPVKTGRGTTEVLVRKGQFIFGRKTAARELRMKEPTVQKRMSKLETLGFCIIQSITHYSLITLVNRGLEETKPEGVSPKVSPKYQASIKQVSQHKKVKNEKNEEKKGKYIVEQARHSSSLLSKEEKNSIPYQEIIDFLNGESGKNFKANSKATRSMIKARWDEGHRVGDFKQVITKKCAKWKGDPKMDDYLRPATLFRPSNFESYLNERDGNELMRTKREEPKAQLWGTEWPSFRDREDDEEELEKYICPMCKALVYEGHDCKQTDEAKEVKKVIGKLAETKRIPEVKAMTEAEVTERKVFLKKQAELLNA